MGKIFLFFSFYIFFVTCLWIGFDIKDAYDKRIKEDVKWSNNIEDYHINTKVIETLETR